MSGKDDDCDPQFVKQGLGIRDVLQEVENALIENGYDDFVVKTKDGSFRWRLSETARRKKPKPKERG